MLPKVSVLLLTYNHEEWISQSIESVLAQKTDFDYELVIIEDCSTDRTREIVIDYQKRYPAKIKLVLAEKNGEYRRNFAAAFLASPSLYIARLDGDDYLTSLDKLQKQADFLDTHTECALCFHNVETFYEDGAQEPWLRNPPDQKGITTLEDLLLSCYIAGPSPMLRNGLFGEFPQWYYAAPSGDWPLYILGAQHGKIGYLDEVMGARRIHSEGMWSKLDEVQQLEHLMTFYVSLNADLDREYEDTIKRAVSIHCGYYTREYCRAQQEANKKRERKLRGALKRERRKSRRLRKRNANLTLRLQRLDIRLRSMQSSRTRKLTASIISLKSKLWGR